MKKHSKGEIAKTILKWLAVASVVTVAVALPGIAQIYMIFQPKNGKDRARVKQSLHGLKKQGFVRTYTRNGKYVIEITKSGRKKVLAYNLQEMKLKKDKKWDGIWRVVIFDIPENKKRARNAISLKLKKLEFFPLQKSVFLTPYPCEDEVSFVSEFFNVSRYVQYLEVSKIDNEDRLRRKFKI